MIANCGGIGLDWKDLSLGEYLEALEAHNDAHASPGSEPKSTGDLDRLRRFVEAHRGAG